MIFNFLSLYRMEQTHPQHPHQKKHFSEEAALDTVEKKIDHSMSKIMSKWFVHKFVSNKIVKQILGAHFVNDVNTKLQPYLKTIFTVIGWISLITWIIGIFSFLISLSWLGFMFSLWFGIGVRVLLYVLLAIAFSLLSLLIGIGLIRFKKWAISLILLWFVVSVLSVIISLIPIWMYSYKAYGSFGSSFFNLLITFVFLVLAVKNEHLFKN